MFFFPPERRLLASLVAMSLLLPQKAMAEGHYHPPFRLGYTPRIVESPPSATLIGTSTNGAGRLYNATVGKVSVQCRS